MLKRCSHCKEEKDLKDFGVDNRNKTGYLSECKECRNKRLRESRDEKTLRKRKEIQDKYRRSSKFSDTSLKRIYGISLKEWQKMFDEQDGCCASCGEHQADLSRTLCVDHDHDTGKVRGLVCRQCNLALGLLKDDPEVVAKLLEYICEYKQ